MKRALCVRHGRCFRCGRLMRTAMHAYGVAWVAATALSLLACGGRAVDPGAAGASGGASDSDAGADAGAMSADALPGPLFPLGVYGPCATTASNGGEGLAGGTLSLTLRVVNGVLTATYSGGGPVSGALDFTVTTDTSANVAPSGQLLPGVWAYCGGGVSDSGAIASPVPAEATLSVAAGELTFDSRTLFLSIVGDVISPDAGCTAGRVAATFTCKKE
jgi:hypothetical protein